MSETTEEHINRIAATITPDLLKVAALLVIALIRNRPKKAPAKVSE